MPKRRASKGRKPPKPFITGPVKAFPVIDEDGPGITLRGRDFSATYNPDTMRQFAGALLAMADWAEQKEKSPAG
jgi:hypothetical protein